MLLFVYGSLRKGWGLHHMLSGSEYKGKGRTYERYALYNYRFPFAVHEDNVRSDAPCLPIVGEVYDVDRITLDNITEYEKSYDCVRRPIILDSGELVRAYTYEFPADEPYGFKLLCDNVGDAYEWRG